ncbi:hypothetical protein EV672_103376 [Aquabacterium commune]|uniref:Uncharacterized protein n=1 Tax=Aquabacterium commune TaxID=70586 RepID=A0A4R6RF07_9BURK|nr:hypothetical protein EV672_103376 [Aquabacterium commune]
MEREHASKVVACITEEADMRHVEAQRLNWSHTVLVGDKQCDSALHLSVGQVVLARRRIQNSNNSCLGVNGSHTLSLAYASLVSGQ